MTPHIRRLQESPHPLLHFLLLSYPHQKQVMVPWHPVRRSGVCHSAYVIGLLSSIIYVGLSSSLIVTGSSRVNAAQ